MSGRTKKPQFVAADFEIATTNGKQSVSGFACAGIGVHSSKRGIWVVTHLASGMAIFKVRGPYKKALQIAQEILACGDWSAKTASELTERNPNIGKLASRVANRHPEAFK